MSTNTKSLSASYIRVSYGVTEKTARLFHAYKVSEAMSSSGNNLMDGGNFHVDEFVLVGQEQGIVGRIYDAKKKKAVTTVQLTDEGMV